MTLLNTGFFPKPEPKYKTRRCQFCGEPGLHWEKIIKVWRLVDEQGRLHECEQYYLTSGTSSNRELNHEHE